MSYREDIVNGFAEAIRLRFQLQEKDATAVNATRILNFKIWPKVDAPEFQGLFRALNVIVDLLC